MRTGAVWAPMQVEPALRILSRSLCCNAPPLPPTPRISLISRIEGGRSNSPPPPLPVTGRLDRNSPRIRLRSPAETRVVSGVERPSAEGRLARTFIGSSVEGVDILGRGTPPTTV